MRGNVNDDSTADIANADAPANDKADTPDVAHDDTPDVAPSDADANAVDEDSAPDDAPAHTAAEETDEEPDDAAADPIDLTHYIARRSSQRYVDAHVRKTYYLRPELYRRLTRLSKTMNVPMSEIVNDALTLFFARLDEAKKGVKK